MRCYIFDIDGTLANGDHRLHFIRPLDRSKVIEETFGAALKTEIAFKPDWDSYFMACGDDTPHEHICELARHLSTIAPIVYVTGRSDVCRDLTEMWLLDHSLPMVPALIYMRPQGDHKPDDQLKIELLEKIRADGFDPIMAFDDRKRVVDAWRKNGIPCAQVADGDF